jgi:hypothetical protein
MREKPFAEWGVVRIDTMHLAALMPLTVDIGRRRERRPKRRVHQAPAPTSTQLARRAGGPQDRALYMCGCGYAFTAAVSTSVGCPECGQHQAW